MAAAAIKGTQPVKESQSPPDRITMAELFRKVAEARTYGVRGNSKSGSAGEKMAILANGWERRPTGKKMKMLMDALQANGKTIQPTSFDALALPDGMVLDYKNSKVLSKQVKQVTFVEIKSGRKENMPADFAGFFFALTFREIQAAIELKGKHVVALINVQNPERGILVTNVWELLTRSTSTNWQLSIQLGRRNGTHLHSILSVENLKLLLSNSWSTLCSCRLRGIWLRDEDFFVPALEPTLAIR